MYGPITQSQAETLDEFDRANAAIQSASRFDGSFHWWTEVAQRAKAIGIFDHARMIFLRHQPRTTKLGRCAVITGMGRQCLRGNGHGPDGQYCTNHSLQLKH